MFLIVFTTLMLSIVGLFVQVATLQTAQMYRSQNGLMQSMLAWHGMAVTKVINGATALAWSTIGSSGCSMTPAASTPALNGPNGVCTTPTPLMPGDKFLLGGYINKFYSVAYQASSTDYVLTFAYPNPLDATGGVSIPDAGGSPTGYTIRDLSAQFMRAAPSGLVFGTVQSAGVLAVPALARQSAASYPVPTWIPPGAIGIISLGN